jgi:prevent-host-death family protein
MRNIVGLKELRQNVDKFVARVGRGESFVVMRRSRPIFRITPVDEEEGWETIIDFTKIPKYRNGIPADELLRILKRMKK